VVVLWIAIAAGPGDVFIPTSVEYEEPQSAATRQVTSMRSRAEQGDAFSQYASRVHCASKHAGR